MEKSPCAPLVPCEDLDGSLLLRRTVYGPALFNDSEPIDLGDVTLDGGVLRPYVDVDHRVTWTAKELSRRGPVASIMSLAPTETVTAAIRTVRRTSFSELLSDAADSSSVSTSSRRKTGPAREAGSRTSALQEMQRQLASRDMVELAPIAAAKFGSFLSDIGAAFVSGATLGLVDPDDVGKAIADTIQGAVAPPSPKSETPRANTRERIEEVISALERQESQHHLHESTVSSSTQTEESLTRTFSNPYRDRSLQLRFIPVYRNFEMRVTVWRFVPGLAAVVDHSEGSIKAREILGDLEVDRDDDRIRRVLAELLGRGAREDDRERGIQVERCLRWEDTQVRANAVHAPLAPTGEVVRALKMGVTAAEDLQKAQEQIDKILAALEEAQKQAKGGAKGQMLPDEVVRDVHVFAGTHIEAVPGECTLPDVVTDALAIEPQA